MRRGADFARHFARRLAILFVIGTAHALIWYGDILKDYALIGLLLIVTARWSATGTGWAAASVLVLRAIWPLAVLALVVWLAPLKRDADPAGDFFALTRVFEGTDLSAMFAANLELLRLKALQMVYDGKAISILGMFLLGAYIGKQRLYRDLASNAPMFRRVLCVAAPLGILGNAALVPIDWMTPEYPPSTMWVVEQALFAIAVPAMTLAYASGFALAWQHKFGRSLASVGSGGTYGPHHLCQPNPDLCGPVLWHRAELARQHRPRRMHNVRARRFHASMRGECDLVEPLPLRSAGVDMAARHIRHTAADDPPCGATGVIDDRRFSAASS